MTGKEEFIRLKDAMQTQIIGQPHLVDRLLICLLSVGHILVEDAPGLAKTKAINALAQRLEGDFKRIQFTPNLLPGDITSTEMYRQQQQSFDFQAGPMFHKLIMNVVFYMTPAKVPC